MDRRFFKGKWKVMRSNKHTEFLKRIRLPVKEKTKNNGRFQGTQRNQTHKMTIQKEIDLQKELNRRFDELFWTTEED